MSERILLIEDDQSFRAMLGEALADKGYLVAAASSAEEGVSRLQKDSFDLVLTDVKLPGMSGIESIPRLKKADPDVDIIVMTAFSTREMAVEAVKLGAYDFFSKPFSLAEMEVVVRRALEKRQLQSEVESLRETIKRGGSLGKIVGQGIAMRSIGALVEKIAGLDTTVLITGESGSGKELISDTLHSLSPRASGPFVKVNCAAIPENLLESELFGHEKGAFTGATTSRPGKFEQARGGSILLDEIGDMPLSIQPKLLRVVEQKQVERLGGGRPVDVDVRIIAATNQDLQSQVREKTFREDLFYRLNVATIHLPPLRERKEDLPFLAAHFLEKVNARLGTNFTGFTAEAVEELMCHDWPGNVRELANAIERAAIVGQGSHLSREEIHLAFQKDLRLVQVPVSAHTPSLKETLAEVEKGLILNALTKSNGKQTQAAAMLGISPKNLWNKLQKHGIEPKGTVPPDNEVK
jgi:two-component system, NtrC family, response regulator AtoC